MKIIGKKLSLKEFKEYVNNKDFGVLPPTFLVLHHTWRPTVESWRGPESIKGLKSYYEGLGWSAGPHLFIAEDGIWLFTDMYEVGIHAGAGNGTLKTGYSIGIEVVGNYDGEVWSGNTYTNTVGAIRVLKEVLKLKEEDIKFHRDYSAKTCPGRAITKEWVINQLTSMKKSNQEFYDSNLKSKGWTTLEDYVEAAKDYKEERDELRDQLDLLEKSLELSSENTRTLLLKQEKINKAHDIEVIDIRKGFEDEIARLKKSHGQELEEALEKANEPTTDPEPIYIEKVVIKAPVTIEHHLMAIWNLVVKKLEDIINKLK